MARRMAIAGVGAVVLVGLSLIVLVLAGRSLFSRAAFGTWDPNALLERITYCDREYQPGSHATRGDIESTGNGFGVFPTREVARTADGKPIVAKPLPDSVCRGADDYFAYGIEGGP